MPTSTTGTLVRPPAKKPEWSPIENVLALTKLDDIGPDIFTNTRPLWHPPGARGIYGGSAIAQCLAAAQRTVPEGYFIHSMHCYFVLAGDATIPVLYHVERVREGRSFATRTVQARQRGRAIFTTTLSFVREGSAGDETVDHASALPDGAAAWLDASLESDVAAQGNGGGGDDAEEDDEGGASPFVGLRMETLHNEAENPEVKRTRQWFKCRGTISAAAGPQGHLSALAYMSDSYFIGTIARVHNLWRWGRPSARPSTTVTGEASRKGADDTKAAGGAANARAVSHAPALAQHEQRENAHVRHDRTIGMMVSLDHSIYFHRPRAIHADQWLFSEMESHWAGDGRGLVFQKIWNRDGTLVATCVQEGLVRLVQGRDKVKL